MGRHLLVLHAAVLLLVVVLAMVDTVNAQDKDKVLPSPFRFQHKLSGKYLRPDEHFVDSSLIRIKSKIDSLDNMRFQVADPDDHGTDEHFGYIVHIDSNQVLAPRDANLLDNTHIVLQRERNQLALFKVDIPKGHIIHHSGKYIHLTSGKHSVVADGHFMVLHSGVHPGMEFIFDHVNACDQHCGNHGWCTASNTCQCADGYKGTYCTKGPGRGNHFDNLRKPTGSFICIVCPSCPCCPLADILVGEQCGGGPVG